jgi:hypothetical protein
LAIRTPRLFAFAECEPTGLCTGSRPPETARVANYASLTHVSFIVPTSILSNILTIASKSRCHSTKPYITLYARSLPNFSPPSLRHPPHHDFNTVPRCYTPPCPPLAITMIAALVARIALAPRITDATLPSTRTATPCSLLVLEATCTLRIASITPVCFHRRKYLDIQTHDSKPLAPISSSGSYTLRPEHRHQPSQGYHQQHPSLYSGYSGPMQNGHPVVPSQQGAQSYALNAGLSTAPYQDPPLAHYSAQGYHAHQHQAMPPPPLGNQIICVECRTTFTRKHDLNRHLGSHHGDASYPCPHCEKSYARLDSLRRHINSPCPGLPRGGGSSASGETTGAAAVA